MHGNEELRHIPRRVISDTLSLEPGVRLKETEDNVAFDCFLFYLKLYITNGTGRKSDPPLIQNHCILQFNTSLS